MFRFFCKPLLVPLREKLQIPFFNVSFLTIQDLCCFNCCLLPSKFSQLSHSRNGTLADVVYCSPITFSLKCHYLCSLLFHSYLVCGCLMFLLCFPFIHSGICVLWLTIYFKDTFKMIQIFIFYMKGQGQRMGTKERFFQLIHSSNNQNSQG